MATLPIEGRWSLRLLAEDDVRDALEFLQRDSLVNVYLISRIVEERVVASTQMVVVRFNGAVVLVASLATNIVVAGDPSVPAGITDAAIGLLADRIITRARSSPRPHGSSLSGTSCGRDSTRRRWSG
jgi:hypothetical protein